MKIIALGYVGLESPNAKAWESFGPEVFGFELADPGSSGSVYLRMADRHHRIAIHAAGQDRLAYLGWELRNDAEYVAPVEQLRAAGVQIELGEEEDCAERRVETFTRFRDPAGYVHEIFYEATFTLGSFRPGKPTGWLCGGHRRALANYKIPRRIEFSETELPKSGSGKILKKVLRDRFWVHQERAVG